MTTGSASPPRKATRLAALLCVAAAGYAVAADPGIDCAKLKLQAVGKTTASVLKCYGRGASFPAGDQACIDRARARMARSFERAELRVCFGPNDGEAETWDAIGAYASTVIANLTPPGRCGLDGDGFTCGGVCMPGSTCGAIGNVCGCFADAFACNASSTVPVVCPKIGQSCVDRSCQDPAGGYCREEPAGSGNASGYCPESRACLFAGFAGCFLRTISCEDPEGACTLFQLPQLGLCPSQGQTCGPDCVCH